MPLLGPGIGPLGLPELVIIAFIVILIFGVGRLPEVGGAVGKSIKEFRKSAQGDDEDAPVAQSAEPAAVGAAAGAATVSSAPAAAAPATPAPVAASPVSESETRFCSECGAKNLRSAKFCAECGNSMTAATR